MQNHRTSSSKSTVNPDQAFLDELQEKLSQELELPHSERNYDRIEEWTDTISFLLGTNELVEKRSQIGIAQLQRNREQAKKAHTKRVFRIMIPCICVALLVLSNIWSYSVWGMNVFSAMYQFTKGGFSVDFNVVKDDPSAEQSNAYLEEMQQICEAQNISARLPKYIPDRYQPTELFGQVVPSKHDCTISFYFQHGKSKLMFQIAEYDTPENIPQMIIPSDQYNISEQTFDGMTVVISKEDQQFTAAFEEGTTQYLLYVDILDYDVCQKILESLFE